MVAIEAGTTGLVPARTLCNQTSQRRLNTCAGAAAKTERRRDHFNGEPNNATMKDLIARLHSGKQRRKVLRPLHATRTIAEGKCAPDESLRLHVKDDPTRTQNPPDGD